MLCRISLRDIKRQRILRHDYFKLGYEIHNPLGYERAMKKALRVQRGWPAYELVIYVSENHAEFLADYAKLQAADRSDETKLSAALLSFLEDAVAMRNKLKEAQSV